MDVSTVILLAAPSRQLRQDDFAGLTTLFGPFFVGH
jgi:hypothetical protein